MSIKVPNDIENKSKVKKTKHLGKNTFGASILIYRIELCKKRSILFTPSSHMFIHLLRSIISTDWLLG
jgi:hypothetical protein